MKAHGHGVAGGGDGGRESRSTEAIPNASYCTKRIAIEHGDEIVDTV